MPISLDAILASERLPSLPEVAARIVEIARSPEPDFEKMIEAKRRGGNPLYFGGFKSEVKQLVLA